MAKVICWGNLLLGREDGSTHRCFNEKSKPPTSRPNTATILHRNKGKLREKSYQRVKSSSSQAVNIRWQIALDFNTNLGRRESNLKEGRPFYMLCNCERCENSKFRDHLQLSLSTDRGLQSPKALTLYNEKRLLLPLDALSSNIA